MSKQKYQIFTGAYDLEMLRIIFHAIASGTPFIDKSLQWGEVKASTYLQEIRTAITEGLIPVLVELAPDLPLEILSQCVVIDHHGDQSHRPASLLQLLELLSVQPNRFDQLVAANDIGARFSMIQMGASEEEIQLVRALERAQQGVTYQMEIVSAVAAQQALATWRENGEIPIIHLPFSKFAAAKDILQAAGCMHMIVACNTPVRGSDGVDRWEVEWQGDGAVTAALDQRFDGWSGGGGNGHLGATNAFKGWYATDLASEVAEALRIAKNIMS